MPVIRRRDSPYFHIEFEFKGKRYRQSAKTRNRQVAEHFERRLRQQVYEHAMLGVPRPIAMTFDEAVRRYKDGHLRATERRPKTEKAAVYLLDRLVRLVGADTPIHAVDAPSIATLRERLLSGGAMAATVNRYLAALRAILRMAHLDWGVLQQVPRVRLFTLRNERTRWLSEDEERALLDASGRVPHLHDLVVFLLDTGTRLGEALDLEWPQVKLDATTGGTVSIMHTKNGRPRDIPLSRRADALLRRLHATRPTVTDRVFVRRTTGCVWRGTRPRVTPFSNPHAAWKTAARRAGLCDVRLHDLRHTFASRLVQREVPLHAVSRLLGHQSLRMTMRYSHLAVADLKRAVEVLD